MPDTAHPAADPVEPVDPGLVAARARTDAALARAAALLDDVGTARAADAARVRAGWRGPHRSRFDAERARRDGELAGLAGRCRRLLGR